MSPGGPSNRFDDVLSGRDLWFDANRRASKRAVQAGDDEEGRRAEKSGEDETTTGTLAPGSERSFVMNTLGTTPIHCSIHPQMVGTLIVQEP